MAPFVIVAALAFRHIARRVTRQSTRAVGEVNKSIQEAVTGIRIAKNFRQEEQIYGEFTAVNNQSYAINVRRGFVLANIFPVLNVLAGIWHGRAGLFWWAKRGHGSYQHRRLVSFRHHRRPLLVSPEPTVRLLEPVPGRPGGRRAGLCPD
jgi:hypothetical protein